MSEKKQTINAGDNIAHNASWMAASGLVPPPVLAPRPLGGYPRSTPRAPARGAIQGRVREVPREQGPQRPQRERGGRRRSPGSNYGGVQKSHRQETSSSTRDILARFENDPGLMAEFQEWCAKRGATPARIAAQSPKAAQEKVPKGVVCGNCLKHGHRVRDCVHPAGDGFIHGCPICNQSNHESAEGCKMNWPQRLEKKLLWAIEYRARRPTVAAFPNWAELFMEAVDMKHTPLPRSFPWSPAFCHALMEGRELLWTNFDYIANDSSSLPIDFITANQDAVCENEEIIRFFPSCVTPDTGGNPWHPTEPASEQTDVVMGEAAESRPPAKEAGDKEDVLDWGIDDLV